MAIAEKEQIPLCAWRDYHHSGMLLRLHCATGEEYLVETSTAPQSLLGVQILTTTKCAHRLCFTAFTPFQGHVDSKISNL